MDWFSSTGNFASIAGLILGALTLYYAKSAKDAARTATREVRRIHASEALNRIGEVASLLQACVENNLQQEAVVRARDLVSEISKYKLRYGRFLDARSKARFDEAREQISVISRFLATKGSPEMAKEKDRLLRICHRDVVMVLNEESAKIIAAIEEEGE